MTAARSNRHDHQPSPPTPRWKTAAWLLPAVALIAAQLRPVLARFDRAVVGTLDGTDAVMQAGILTWSASTCWRPGAWVDLPIFYPTAGAIACMDSLLGQALLVAPLRLVANPSPALLYNVACLGTLVLVTLAGALLWRATASDSRDHVDAGVGAGLCALFLLGSPFTAWKLGMLNQITPPWVVLLLVCTLFGWRRLGERGSAGPWWWAAAACLAIQAAWGWYGFAASVFILAVVGPVGLVLAWRRRRLRSSLRQVILPAAAATVAVLVVAWPHLEFRQRHEHFGRGVNEVRFYSASFAMVGNLGPHRATWADLAAAGQPAAERALRNVDAVLHPGWLTLVLALAGVASWRRLSRAQRRIGLLLAAIGAVGVVMAFGESGALPPGSEMRLKLPFGYLRDLVPAFEAYRAPVRFVYLTVIAFAWWATLGVLALAARLRPAWSRLVVAAAFVLVWLESVPMGLLAVPIVVDGRPGSQPLPAAVPAGPVLTLPDAPAEQLERVNDAAWLLRAMATGRHVTGGTSGWVPPASRELRARLAACEDGEVAPDSLLAGLRRQGIVVVEVAVDAGEPSRVAFWERALREDGYAEASSVSGYRVFWR